MRSIFHLLAHSFTPTRAGPGRRPTLWVGGRDASTGALWSTVCSGGLELRVQVGGQTQAVPERAVDVVVGTLTAVPNVCPWEIFLNDLWICFSWGEDTGWESLPLGVCLQAASILRKYFGSTTQSLDEVVFSKGWNMPDFQRFTEMCITKKLCMGSFLKFIFLLVFEVHS